MADFNEIFAAEQQLIAERRGGRASSVRVGLALSGGGIRSAAFNLGLLQALGEKSVLADCDYLSTVSGGGYIGACLSGLCTVDGIDATRDHFPFRRDPQNRIVKYLRQHSEYLAPRHGLFRLDTWRLISAYLGGLLLTLLTTGALLGVGGALGIAVYPWIGGSVAQIVNQLGIENPGVVRVLALFGPTAIAAILWLVATFLYALATSSSWVWTLGYRRWTSRFQGLALAGAVILAAFTVMPFLFTELGPRISQLFAAGSLSAVTLTRVFTLGREVKETWEKVRRWGVTIGSAIFVAFICMLVLYGVWSYREYAFTIAAALGVLLLVLWTVTDINRISMYHFYRDRLNEAFVIKPDDTAPGGVRPTDDLPLSGLASVKRQVPYHLLNATVNLAGSEDPARQHRKADFFVFSPLYCGSDATGYRATSDYEKDRIKLASAMAVSGAALNPQQGYGTNTALAFLMTVLNVRLGVWYQNPRYAPRVFRGARIFWPLYLLQELFSFSNEKRHLISLSDGGHIENLGVYQLLKRRCDVVIASDASADPETTFEDLGNVARKARIDLGLEVVLDPTPVVPDGVDRLGKAHFAAGEVKDGTGRAVGRLFYIKPVLTKGDPVDLHEYRKRREQFPHEPTSDQFFDEAQFESYRELGYRSGMEVAAAMS